MMDRIGSLGRFARLAAATLLLAVVALLAAPDARAHEHAPMPAAEHEHHVHHAAPASDDMPAPLHDGDCHCVSAACAPLVAPVVGSLAPAIALPRAGHPLPPSLDGRPLADVPPLAEPPEA